MSLIEKAISLAKAIVKGSFISEERLAKRIELCLQCENIVKYVTGGEEKFKCGICTCKLDGDKHILNLAAYEETDSYGCKHKNGSVWKKNGV